MDTPGDVKVDRFLAEQAFSLPVCIVSYAVIATLTQPSMCSKLMSHTAMRSSGYTNLSLSLVCSLWSIFGWDVEVVGDSDDYT